MQNNMAMMYLHIIIIEFIRYAERYNMYKCLLIIINIFKVKVSSSLECVPFADVLHRNRGGFVLQPPQKNILDSRGIFSTRIETAHVYDIELTRGNKNLPDTTDFDADIVLMFC